MVDEGGKEFEPRAGEIRLSADPAAMPGDAHIVFIGKVHSPWKSRADCPKNMAQARDRRGAGSVELFADYRPGLAGLSRFSHVVLISWFDRSPRDLIVQAPRHASEPRGTFALRSPVRPNPMGLHIARIVDIDEGAGVIGIDAIDLIDGTPIVDIKPYFPSIDSFPDATRPGEGGR